MKKIYIASILSSIFFNMYPAELVKKSEEDLFIELNNSFFGIDEVEKRSEKAKKIDVYLKKYPQWVNKEIDGETPATLAVCKHEDETLDVLLDNGADIRQRVGALGLPLLHIACHYVNDKAVEKILKKDPTLAEFIEPAGNTTTLYQLSQSNEVLISEITGYSPEEYRAKKQKVAELLISSIRSESFLFRQDALGETPLHLAAKLSKKDFLKKLLSIVNPKNRNELLFIKNKKGYVAFDYAFQSKNQEMIEMLWIEQRDYDFLRYLTQDHIHELINGNSRKVPLSYYLGYAVKSAGPNYLSVLEHLVFLGADLNERIFDNKNVLSVLVDDLAHSDYAGYFNFQTIKYLLESGVDITHKNRKEELVFDELLYQTFSKKYSTIEDLEYLIKKGESIYPSCKKFHTNMLYAAVKSGDISKIRWVLNKGVDINNGQAWEAIYIYHYDIPEEILKVLIESGLDLSYKSIGDERYLDLVFLRSCSSNKATVEFLKYLVSQGANINYFINIHPNDPVICPLNSAIRSENLSKVKWLIDQKVDLSISKKGKTALELAKKIQDKQLRKQMIACLEEADSICCIQ